MKLQSTYKSRTLGDLRRAALGLCLILSVVGLASIAFAKTPAEGGEAGDRSSAEAQAVFPEPKGVIPQPVPPIHQRFVVTLRTDRSVYYPGDVMRVTFYVSRDCYLYIFDTDTRGVQRQIFPNYFDRDNRIPGGRSYFIPDPSYVLRVTGPAGYESLRAVAVADRYPICQPYEMHRQDDPYPQRSAEGLMRSLSEAPRPSPKSGKGGGKDDKNIIFQPAPQGVQPVPVPAYQYAEARASFYVQETMPGPWQGQQGLLGRLRVVTSPSSADVYLDREYKGHSPLTIKDIPFGAHDVYVEKRGYMGQFQRVAIDGPTEGYIKIVLRREGYGAYTPAPGYPSYPGGAPGGYPGNPPSNPYLNTPGYPGTPYPNAPGNQGNPYPNVPGYQGGAYPNAPSAPNGPGAQGNPYPNVPGYQPTPAVPAYPGYGAYGRPEQPGEGKQPIDPTRQGKGVAKDKSGASKQESGAAKQDKNSGQQPAEGADAPAKDSPAQ